jgi:hypothetical protein
MTQGNSNSPFRQLFRNTPPEVLSAMLRPALKRAWEDVQGIHTRAEALREKDAPSGSEPGA